VFFQVVGKEMKLAVEIVFFAVHRALEKRGKMGHRSHLPHP
jgi:hypothetical protein